jgi:hypothetical protein
VLALAIRFPGPMLNLAERRWEHGTDQASQCITGPIDQQLPFTLVHGGGGNERTRFVCGYIGCDARPFNPLLAALPPLIVVSRPPDEDPWIIDILRLTLTEASSQRPGARRSWPS